MCLSGHFITPAMMWFLFARGERAIDGLNAYNPKVKPIFTVYNVNSHNSWTKAYQTGPFGSLTQSV